MDKPFDDPDYIFEHDAVVRAVVQNDDGIQVDGVGLGLRELIVTTCSAHENLELNRL